MNRELPREIPPPDELVRMFRAEPRNALLALFTGAQLEKAGRREEAVAVWSLGDDVDLAVRRLKDSETADPQMREDSKSADKAMREFFTEQHEQAVDDFAKETGDDVTRVRAGIWSLTHARAFEFETPMQKPVIFYMPGLPATPVTDNERLPWVSALEASYADILAEYQAAAATEAGMVPYVPAQARGPEWQKLSGALDWSAIYLFKDAKPTNQTARFPKTLAALEGVDLVRVDGAPMEVFFSRLKPGAHIPPHYGLTNTRLTVHLPLIVPDDCAIRVGEGEYHWREGELIAFDDSFEHEAWNRAPSDRVVLIFETHHPDLSAAECAAIEHAYSVRQNWLQNRTALLGWRQPN